MSVRDAIQQAMKDAMRAKDTARLECLRMAKGAMLLKEKDGSGPISDSDAYAAIRSEIKKRQQSVEIFREHGREDEAQVAEREIATLTEFLPQQLSAEAIEEQVRAYLAAHPEMNHAGKLTGAMKKELGDRADGKLLNEICKRVVEG
jgi:uncharacterized protein